MKWASAEAVDGIMKQFMMDQGTTSVTFGEQSGRNHHKPIAKASFGDTVNKAYIVGCSWLSGIMWLFGMLTHLYIKIYDDKSLTRLFAFFSEVQSA